MDLTDLKSRFTYHPPKSDEVAKQYVQIREKAHELALLVNTLCPEGREKSLAVTHIEEAVMWANASIARS